MNRMRIPVLALALVGASFLAASAQASSSNLQNALEHLQAARNDLEQSSRKDNHSKQALQAVDQAIDHVRKGLDEEQKKEGKATKEEQKKQEKTTQQQQKEQEKATQTETKKTKK